MMQRTRRALLRDGLILAASTAIGRNAFGADDPTAPYRTPYKYPELLLRGTAHKGDFDEIAVDDPIVFRANGAFHMLYIGFDGTGYQTGLARSKDLLHWERVALVGPRDRASKWTKYNLAISSILRDKRLDGPGDALKHDGKYLAAWNAYPGAGYESGAAVIGLATSSDLLHWELTEPILKPEDGAPWEHGGLYRPDLLRGHDGTFYLYYNAKTDTLPKSEGGGWHEQTGVATSRDLVHWTRYANNPILSNGPHDSDDGRFASNPFVVTRGRGYGMYYLHPPRPRQGAAGAWLRPIPLHQGHAATHRARRARDDRRDLRAQALGDLPRGRAVSLLLRRLRQVAERGAWYCRRTFEAVVKLRTFSSRAR
jgi:hypothetical protein